MVHQNDHFRFQQHCLSILMIRKHHTAVPARLQSICVISFRSIRITITASPTVNMIADPCFQAGRRNKLLWRIRTSTTIVIGQIYTFVLLCVLCRYNSELLLSFDIWFNWYRYLQTPPHISTSSPAVAEMPRDALYLSVVRFNSVIPRAQSFIIITSVSDLALRTIKAALLSSA